jgi:histidine triad (HIT) family protein
MQAPPCLFCRIIAKELPSDTLLETDAVVAFRDIHPQAPTHILVIPKQHLARISDLERADAALLAELLQATRTLAQQEGIATRGYRLVVNCGSDAGQAVEHLHIHLLGGRRLQWPPG